MLDKLKKNDEVMTSGGIYGKVVALTDEGGDFGGGCQREDPRAPASDLSRCQRRERRQQGSKGVIECDEVWRFDWRSLLSRLLISLVYLAPTFVTKLPAWWNSFLPTERFIWA